MDEFRPSFEHGVLCIPGRGGQYAALKLSNHRGDADSSSFDFEISIPGVIAVTGGSGHLERHYSLASMWDEVPVESNERGSWRERQSEDGNFCVHVEHDGLGHYVLHLKLRPRGYSPDVVAEVPVMVEAGWLPRVAEWWKQFLGHPIK